MTDRVIIFDTTLRDGEQALKASLTVKEKLQIALALERLGVDVMEVGFPVSSQGDFESVQTIARHIKNSRVAALSRAVIKDIDAAAEALKVAEAFRIHTFIAVSALHVEAKLKRTFDDVVEMAVAAVNVHVTTPMMWSFLAKMQAVPVSTIFVVLLKRQLMQVQQL